MYAHARNFIRCSLNGVHVAHVRTRGRSRTVLANERKRKRMQTQTHRCDGRVGDFCVQTRLRFAR